jgi:hypothetical protein
MAGLGAFMATWVASFLDQRQRGEVKEESDGEKARRFLMQAVHNGQCGLCNHFGEHHAKTQVLVTILSSKKADESLLDECGHPKHAALHLKVSPISGCDGFVPAAQA